MVLKLPLVVVQEQGFEKLVVQIGNGEEPPLSFCDNKTPLTCQFFRLKPSLADDINNSSLVIGHAGNFIPRLFDLSGVEVCRVLEEE